MHKRGSLSHWLSTTATWERTGGVQAGTDKDADIDVLIIGGGICGASVALHLRRLKPDVKVLLVEARGISEGATGRNGGLMWPSLNAPWPTTVQQYGHAGARQLMEFELHAFKDVVGFVQDHQLEEELQFSMFPDGAYSLCNTKAELDIELADVESQQAMGLEPLAKILSADDITRLLGPHSFCGGLRQDKVARVTAVRLAHALLRQAVAVEPKSALTVLQHTRVSRIERLPGGGFSVVAIPEDTGSVAGPPADASKVVIKCKHVVHCTNGYNHLLPVFKQLGWLVPVRNQVAVTVPLPAGHPMPQAAFYARNGFVYWSRRRDGRVVIGGFRDVTPHLEWGTTDDSFEGLDPAVSALLRLYLPMTFPHMFSPIKLLGPPVPPAFNTTSKHMLPMRTAAASKNLGAAGLLQASPTSVQEPAGGPVRDSDRAKRSSAPFPIEYELEWSGILGFTKDRWPIVGQLPAQLCGATGTPTSSGSTGSGEYCCMGFSGHGMTRAYTCAKNLALMLVGAPVEDSFPLHVFSPERVLHDLLQPTQVPAASPVGPHLGAVSKL